MTSLPFAVSTVGIIVIVLAALAVLFLIGGIVAVLTRDRRQAGSWREHVAEADSALEAARALDKGWHRETMEEAVRRALGESRPGVAWEDLHLVFVDDRPGKDEDRAHFMAVGPEGEARVILARSGDRWVAERVEQLRALVSATAAALVPGFEPESEVESALARDPVLVAGWAWGEPRAGHPEGSVGEHVADLLARIDERGIAGERRRELRFLALVHDSLKNRVHEWLPKRGENHHAMRARRFAESYTNDERLLATLQFHDRPYAIWRRTKRTGAPPDRALGGCPTNCVGGG